MYMFYILSETRNVLVLYNNGFCFPVINFYAPNFWNKKWSS